MPVYNGGTFIGAAVESVLGQTFTQFELLIIDDGSTDRTAEFVSGFADRDPRIRLITREHCGLVDTLNYGLEQARGHFLARLDADDTCAPHRLEVQKNCLEARPEVVIVGSAYTLIDASGAPVQTSYMPQSDVAIRWHGLFHSPFAHSSVMLRIESMRRFGLGYDPSMREAEDYALWSQLLQHGRGYNLPEPLVQYRQHSGQASQQGQPDLWEFAGRVAQKNLISLGAPLPIEAVQRLRKWYYHFPSRFDDEDLSMAEALLDIIDRFSLQPGLDRNEVARIRGRWRGRLLRSGLRSSDKAFGFRLLAGLRLGDLREIISYRRSRDKS